ncbi:phage holin family protein [Patescibacteria group bacterium]|nr:phage holin family protein [Patescibacteria group bacterium]MBU4458632.1 phage holin family protein [Patescibacteria group bacterium]MCG2695958.1 phage holin family protein [Candidatus Portnoybacteria bacterium]
MRFITKLILQILANALAIFIAVRYVHGASFGIDFTGDLVDYLIVGLILALANTFARPILKILSAPLIFITMGLFLIVINAIILFAVDWFIEALTITGFMGYFWSIIIISIVNAVIVGGFKKNKKYG